jgi:hypothetical protein
MTLFSLTLKVLTPHKVMEYLIPVKNLLMEWFKENKTMEAWVVAYTEPLVALTVDFLIVPALVDISCEFEDFRRKSTRQISIMRRIYTFMLINTLLVPLAQA